MALKEYKRVFENILAVEKKLDSARKHLVSRFCGIKDPFGIPGMFQQAACEDKEKKLQKELVKGPKDVAATQDKLKQVTDSLQLATAEGKHRCGKGAALYLFSCSQRANEGD